MPQMSPMYWLYISLICYLNFMLIMSLMNSLYFSITVFKMNMYVNMWKWSW